MSESSDTNDAANAVEGDGDCQLPRRDQTRNLLLVGTNTALSYLASPVLYVGVIHVSLCQALDASATVFNLPASAYLLMSLMPLFVCWYLPRAGQLRGIVTTCYFLMACGSLLVAATVIAPLPNQAKLAVIVLHGGLIGATRSVAVACEFEVLGRGVSSARRGPALALAYGVGPLLAIVGNLVSQLVLTGALGPIVTRKLGTPENFAALFAITMPVLGLAAWLASRLVIPIPEAEPPRPPFLQGVFGGFGRFLSQRIILQAMIAAIVVMSGYAAISNLAAYIELVMGRPSADFAGYANAIRFGFKAVTGLAMGWLLTRTHPKAGVLITALLGLSAIVWAIITPRESPRLFFLSFGLLGAGELFGIYITNYILSMSPPALMRRYMAFTMLTLFPCAFAGLLFGWIKDQYTGDQADSGLPFGWIKDQYTGEQAALGFQASFAVAAVFVMLGIVLALFLPARPKVDAAHSA
jgi:hypothetical protein